ncbi:MAG TPA: cellulase family glycosylhydrolase [Acidimicrobiia bacterium]
MNPVSMNVGAVPAGGPVRNTNYPVYSDALLNWYRDMGMTSVRLMFTWEAVQSTLGGPVPAPGANYATYWSDLMSVVTRLLARGMVVTLAPWQYNPASRTTDVVYQGQAITAAGFADFWGKLASAVTTATANDRRVAFDLINEPHTDQESGLAGDLGIGLDDWFTCAQAAITSIRAAGVTNTIPVPGMTWTAASAFTTNGSAAKWTSLNDPQKNLGVTVHCYSGVEGAGAGSPTVLRDACAALVQWARPRGAKVHIGEIAIDAGDNGRPPFGSTLPLAQAQWADWQQFCLANDDVIVGWNWWGNSALGWWDQGDSKNGHHWGLTLTDGATHTVATLGAPAEHFYVTTPRAPSLMARRPVPMSGVGHRP